MNAFDVAESYAAQTAAINEGRSAEAAAEEAHAEAREGARLHSKAGRMNHDYGDRTVWKWANEAAGPWEAVLVNRQGFTPAGVQVFPR